MSFEKITWDGSDSATILNQVGLILNYKGTKTTISALPTPKNTIGDVWHVAEDNDEYVWNGSSWEALGSAVAEPPSRDTSRDIKAFKCPNCGGNSYKTINGKIVCEYCDTEFVR